MPKTRMNTTPEGTPRSRVRTRWISEYPPRPPIGTADFIDLWFPDRRDPQATCFICGLHVKFAQQQMVQINYGVSGQFMIIWNRVMMTLPPR